MLRGQMQLGDECPSFAGASSQWHPNVPILPEMLQGFSVHPPTPSPSLNPSSAFCYMDRKSQHELYEDTKGKIFSFSPVLFFTPSVSLSAIS